MEAGIHSHSISSHPLCDHGHHLPRQDLPDDPSSRFASRRSPQPWTNDWYLYQRGPGPSPARTRAPQRTPRLRSRQARRRRSRTPVARSHHGASQHRSTTRDSRQPSRTISRPIANMTDQQRSTPHWQSSKPSRSDHFTSTHHQPLVHLNPPVMVKKLLGKYSWTPW